VRKGVRNHFSLSAFLYRIVTDLVCSQHRFLDIPLFQVLAVLACPDPCKEICMQLQTYRLLIEIGLTAPLGECCRNSKKILHVMGNFMRDDVCLGKISRSLQRSGEFIKEAQIYIDAAIRRTVEGADPGVPQSALSRILVAENHEFWRTVRESHLIELLCPDYLGVRKNDTDKLELLLFLRRSLIIDFPQFAAAEQCRGINQTELPARKSEYGERDQALNAKKPCNHVEQQTDATRSSGYALATSIPDI
jgi:hypothetical protein